MDGRKEQLIRRIAKYAALTVFGIILFKLFSRHAYLQRGYEAVGGEIFFLLVPFFYWLFENEAEERRRRMAHVETWYRCPCGAKYSTKRRANECAIKHVKEEKWAVSDKYKGKAVRIYPRAAPGSYRSTEWALQEADLSDNAEERQEQLKERSEKDGQPNMCQMWNKNR